MTAYINDPPIDDDALDALGEAIGLRRTWEKPTGAHPVSKKKRKEAAKARKPFWVLDRPNPITGTHVEGPIMEKDLESFVGCYDIPLRHGMTFGELATFANAEGHLGADLHVVKMTNWMRGYWFDATTLSWVDPSPNMRSLNAALLYPGLAMLEASPDYSVGRGTDTPFEQIGAPWIKGPELAAALNARAVPGVRFYPVSFTPAAGAKLGGQACHGVFIVITDRERLRPVRLGLEIASALSRLYGQQFRLEDAAYLLGSKAAIARIRAGNDPAEIASASSADEATWRVTRAKYLLY